MVAYIFFSCVCFLVLNHVEAGDLLFLTRSIIFGLEPERAAGHVHLGPHSGLWVLRMSWPIMENLQTG